MTKQEFAQFHKQCCERMHDIMLKKNADYTGGTGESPFANFMDSESFAGVTTEQGFMVRLSDKFARVRSFIKKGVLQVKDESVEDTLLDAANYCLLLAGYIKSLRRNTSPHAVEYTKSEPAPERSNWVGDPHAYYDEYWS